MRHDWAMSENLVDDYKNLIPFTIPDIRQFDITWNSPYPLYEDAFDAQENPVNLNVNQGTITSYLNFGQTRYAGFNPGIYLISAFAHANNTVLTNTGNDDCAVYPTLLTPSGSGVNLYQLSSPLIHIMYTGTTQYVVMEKNVFLILRVA